MFDAEKSKNLDCGQCSTALQSLRNCSGRGRPATIDINGSFYTQCPRAIYLSSNQARYFVNLYLHCKEKNVYPAPGSPNMQTQFTMSLFEYIAELIEQSKLRQAKAGKSAS